MRTLLNGLYFVRLSIRDFDGKLLESDVSIGNDGTEAASYLLDCHNQLNRVQTIKTKVFGKGSRKRQLENQASGIS